MLEVVPTTHIIAGNYENIETCFPFEANVFRIIEQQSCKFIRLITTNLYSEFTLNLEWKKFKLPSFSF